MELTPHFSLLEFTKSQTAERLGIANNPDDKQLANLLRTAQVMEQVRLLLSAFIIVSSGFRSPELNLRIGGVVTSAHCDGRGCDFTAYGWPNIQAARMIRDSSIAFDQLILEYGWIHLGIAESGVEPRREVMTKRAAHLPYEKGLIG